MSKSVAVLMGGWSSEREVSLVSGAAVTRALKLSGYDVTPIDVKRDVAAFMEALTPRPDAVFNALHGRWGEDGCVQGLLEILGVPYTHSGVLASALAMDKVAAKVVFAQAGIAVVEDQILSREEFFSDALMDPPYVVKPINEGSSVDVFVVEDAETPLPFSEDRWPFGERVMVERFVPGRELTVAVMGDKALGVTEIATDRSFYDYDAKYADGGSRHVLPAELDPDIHAKAERDAIAAHQALGCRGVSRADFRLDGDRLVILEVNTQPGMTPTSLVPEQAAHAGYSFDALVAWMVDNAEYGS